MSLKDPIKGKIENTMQKISLLHSIFVIFGKYEIKPFANNEWKRLAKTPNLYFATLDCVHVCLCGLPEDTLLYGAAKESRIPLREDYVGVCIFL
ncbi:hypothetical protein Lac3_14580 [Claveliimonas bilis]|nr:hypothetical protein Lac3_14580 [Claveliimonas bilis]